MFKGKGKTTYFTDTIIEECASILNNLNKLFTEENRAVLSAELSKAGFKKKEKDST